MARPVVVFREQDIFHLYQTVPLLCRGQEVLGTRVEINGRARTYVSTGRLEHAIQADAEVYVVLDRPALDDYDHCWYRLISGGADHVCRAYLEVKPGEDVSFLDFRVAAYRTLFRRLGVIWPEKAPWSSNPDLVYGHLPDYELEGGPLIRGRDVLEMLPMVA